MKKKLQLAPVLPLSDAKAFIRRSVTVQVERLGVKVGDIELNLKGENRQLTSETIIIYYANTAEEIAGNRELQRTLHHGTKVKVRRQGINLTAPATYKELAKIQTLDS